MFDSLVAARRVLDDLAVAFEASALSPEVALRVVDELGAIRRVVDGMTAKAAKRATEGDAHVGFGVKAVARMLASQPERSAPRSRRPQSSRAFRQRIERYARERCRPAKRR